MFKKERFELYIPQLTKPDSQFKPIDFPDLTWKDQQSSENIKSPETESSHIENSETITSVSNNSKSNNNENTSQNIGLSVPRRSNRVVNLQVDSLSKIKVG